ncbi:Mitochondrial inner membrane protease subunit [Plasmodiophora brassicae]|uniref:Mitochondrial inner membrane protease subunit n=1 Tax=Plasmodiophora brassicae TaxID=37360 RepID=A0A0G4J7S2_PLABS|nr:hypothetical protein PBRA_003086 [Plasmodiophora brassicae]SPQ95567.1 unnamed protein product [Plasmodiophora brassicae]
MASRVAGLGAFLEWGCKAGVAFYAFNNHVAFLSASSGPSMLPTLNLRGDVVLCDALSPKFGRLRKGDIVVCGSPRSMDKIIVKRIVGMPGETVSYTRRGGFWEGAPVTVHVPPGHIFLQGDNPADSVDSRDYGPVPLALVKGRVMFKLWPFYEMGPFRRTLDATGDPSTAEQ